MISAQTQPAPDRAIDRTRRCDWWIPVLLLGLFAGQSLWFIRTQSLTYDEPGHLVAGLDSWQQHAFSIFGSAGEHLILPLPRLWLMLPLARHEVEITSQPLASGYRVTAMQPGPEWLAWHTRPMNTALGVLLGVALWFATRRLFSEGAANTALTLFAFTPSLIAHFSVVTSDGVAALFIFLAAYQLVRWRHDPNRRQTVLLGLVLGGLLLAKFSTPPEMLLALVLMLVLGRDGIVRHPRQWNWSAAGLALAIALLTWWAGYFFHVSHIRVADGHVVASFPNRGERDWPTKSKVQLSLLVPAGEYFEGLRETALENHRGLPAWFLGRVYAKGGPKLYYPVAIALKWPTMLLLLFFGSLLLGVRKTRRAPGDLVILASFAVLYLAFALQSRITIGERHLLPVYPFVLLMAGGIWEHAHKHRAGVAVLILALCLNAADAMRYAPDYLAYFNVFVNPDNSWRLLTDSNLDWGQGLIALRAYEQQHPDETLHVAYFGSVDPALYGIKAVPLAPGEPSNGKVVIGATCLSGQLLADPGGYRWLWAYPPQRVLEHAMWVFDTAGK